MPAKIDAVSVTRQLGLALAACPGLGPRRVQISMSLLLGHSRPALTLGNRSLARSVNLRATPTWHRAS